MESERGEASLMTTGQRRSLPFCPAMLQKYTGLTAGPAVDGLDETLTFATVLNDLVRAMMALSVHEKRRRVDRANADGGLHCSVSPAFGPAMESASLDGGSARRKCVALPVATSHSSASVSSPTSAFSNPSLRKPGNAERLAEESTPPSSAPHAAISAPPRACISSRCGSSVSAWGAVRGATYLFQTLPRIPEFQKPRRPSIARIGCR